MRHRISNRTFSRLILFAIALTLAQTGIYAQGRGGGRGGPPQAPKAGAPIDLTGYWVSIVTEDWRYRMVTPAWGDYEGVPMTPAAIKIADAWDPKKAADSPDPASAVPRQANQRVCCYSSMNSANGAAETHSYTF